MATRPLFVRACSHGSCSFGAGLLTPRPRALVAELVDALP